MRQYDFCTPPEFRAGQCPAGRASRGTQSCNQGTGSGCSQQSVNTGFIPVTLVVRESPCVDNGKYTRSICRCLYVWVYFDRLLASTDAYCGPHGTCAKPGGCICNPEYSGRQCDQQRSSGASVATVSAVGIVAAVVALLA